VSRSTSSAGSPKVAFEIADRWLPRPSGNKSSSTAEATIRECAELGIKQTWMHRSFGEGSVCDDATIDGGDHGITVIDEGCALMLEPTADFGHKITLRVYPHGQSARHDLYEARNALSLRDRTYVRATRCGMIEYADSGEGPALRA